MKLPDHQEHLEIAARTVPVFRAAHRVCLDVCQRFGSSRNVAKKAAQFARAANALQSELDAEYHAVTSDTQFEERRHVYYPGERLADHGDADIVALGLHEMAWSLSPLLAFGETATSEEKAAFVSKHADRLGELLLFDMVPKEILRRLDYDRASKAALNATVEAAIKAAQAQENNNAVE